MRTNHNRIYKLLIVTILACAVILSGCSSGGGGTGGGDDSGGTTTTKSAKLSVLSVNSTLGRYNASTPTSISMKNKLVVTIGINPTAALDIYGYQCALQFAGNVQLDKDNSDDLLNAFDIVYDVDSTDARIVRIMAVPKQSGSHQSVSKNRDTALVQIAFNATAGTGKATFNLVDQEDEGFKNSLYQYDNGNPVELEKLTYSTTSKRVNLTK